MSKELLLIVDAVANEKAVPREAIFDALETALAAAKRKQLAPEEARIRVEVDRKDGSYQAWRQWEVVEDDAIMEDPARQLRLMDALDEFEGDIEAGDVLETPIEPPELGRVAAQTVKQILVQRVRDSERDIVRAAWADRVGEMVMGTVKRFERGVAYIDLGGNAEGAIARNHQIPGEKLRVGHRVRSVLVAVNDQAKGPPLTLSRTDPALMVELFRMESPEVGQGIVEIKACARDPGQRAKIAVLSHDKRVDPIGACIGMRGARVQAISNELNGERVDIVLWNDNDAQFVVSAMAPAEIEKMLINEDLHTVDLAVNADRVALAIGRGGQNIRLASRLTGWQLNLMSVEDFDAKAQADIQMTINHFSEALDVDHELAGLLAENGFTSIEEIAYVPVGELLAVEGFDDEIVEELQARAREVLLDQALMNEENIERSDLFALEGMTEAMVQALGERGVMDQAALADLAVDEILDIEGMDEALAGKLIMAARQPLFA